MSSEATNHAVRAIIVSYVVPLIGILLSTFLYASPIRAILAQRRSHYDILSPLEDPDLLIGAGVDSRSHNNTAITISQSVIKVPEPLNPFPFLCLVQTSIATFLYSIVIQNYFLAIRCLIGFLLSNWNLLSIYATVLLVHPRRFLYETMFYSMLVIILVGNMITIMQYSRVNPWLADKISGVIHIFNLTLFYASPLSEIIRVCRKKDAQIILFSLAITSWINSVMWGIYGFVELNNPFVYVPNMLGIIFATTQLFLKYRFPHLDESSNRTPLELLDIQSVIAI